VLNLSTKGETKPLWFVPVQSAKPEDLLFDEKHLVRRRNPHLGSDSALTFYLEGKKPQEYKLTELVKDIEFLNKHDSTKSTLKHEICG
jgi:hypothetical protein